jgi:aryl sulfotransferase
VHFNDLKRDMPGQMRRIAAFLGLQIQEVKWPLILEYCSFAWMKLNATKFVPLDGAIFEGGAQSFIHKGSNGRWSETLTASDSAEYEAMAVRELGPECAQWLAGR